MLRYRNSLIDACKGFFNGGAIVGTISTEMLIFFPVSICTDTVAVFRVLYEGASAPKEVNDTLSLAVGCNWS